MESPACRCGDACSRATHPQRRRTNSRRYRPSCAASIPPHLGRRASAQRPGGYAKSLMIGDRRGTGRRPERALSDPRAGGRAGLLILAVACGNLGSLLLARGVAREREIAIRVAVGAGKGRLIRQLFTESLLLAMVGSLAGLAVGYAVLRGLVVAPRPAWLNPSPDWRVAAFPAGVGFASAMLFGLAPAVQVARQRHRAKPATGTDRRTGRRELRAADCGGTAGPGARPCGVQRPGFEYRQVVSIDPGLARMAIRRPGRGPIWTLPGPSAASCRGPTRLVGGQPALGEHTEMAGHDVGGRVRRFQSLRRSAVPRHDENSAAAGPQSGRAVRTRDYHQRIAGPSRMADWGPPGKVFSMGNDYTVVGVAGARAW